MKSKVVSVLTIRALCFFVEHYDLYPSLHVKWIRYVYQYMYIEPETEETEHF